MNKKGEMKFEQLEKEIRLLVSQNKLREAINRLNDFFTEDVIGGKENLVKIKNFIHQIL